MLKASLALSIASFALSSAQALTMDEFAGTYTQHSLFKNQRTTDTLKIERVTDTIAKVVFKTRGDETDGCQLEVLAQLMKGEIVFIESNPSNAVNCAVVVASVGPNKTIIVADPSGQCSQSSTYCKGKGEDAITLNTAFSYNSRTLPNGKSATRVEPQDKEELCFGFTNPEQADASLPSVYVTVDKGVLTPKLESFSMSVALAEPKTEKIDFYMDIGYFVSDAKQNLLKCTLSDEKSKVNLKNNLDGSVSLVRDKVLELEQYVPNGGRGRVLRLDKKENESFKLYPTPCKN